MYENCPDKFLEGETVISLGFSCVVKRTLHELLKVSTIQFPFDFIGSPPWAFMPVFKHMVEGHNLPLTIAKKKVMSNEPEFMVWEELYIRILHHLRSGTSDEVNSFKTTFLRCCERLNSVMSTSKRIIAIRLEEWMCERVIDPVLETKYQICESDYLKQLLMYIRKHFPRLEFFIILITSSTTTPTYDRASGLISIPKNKDMNITWEDGDALKRILIMYKGFISTSIGSVSTTTRRIVRIRRTKK